VNCGRCESVAPPTCFKILFSFFGSSQTLDVLLSSSLSPPNCVYLF
jgi:hypothetical protein